MMSYKATVVLLLIHQIFGYKINSILNITSIENKGQFRIATYKLNLLNDDIFPLPFRADDYIIMEDFDKVDKVRIKTSDIRNVTFKLNHKFWNFPINFVDSRGSLCNKLFFIHEIDISKLLNDVFECKNQVLNYKARFYFMHSERKRIFLAPNGLYIEYMDEIKIYWLIYCEKYLLFNNKVNFKVFLKTCNSTHEYLRLFVVVGLMFLVIILVQFLLCCINKKNVFSNPLNSIIMVQPINVVKN
ncbi:hypothetical protein ACKWTF_001586 [Chironomus riparius]